MQISSIIQKHYCQKSTLLIPLAVDSVRHTFNKLATTGIARGNRWNPFSQYYQFKVHWDGNTARLEGPFGLKMVPLITEITLEPAMSRDFTLLKLMVQFPLKYINTSLMIMCVLLAMTLVLPAKTSDNLIWFKLIILSFWLMIFYLFYWMYFIYSRGLVFKCLPEEFSNVERG